MKNVLLAIVIFLTSLLASCVPEQIHTEIQNVMPVNYATLGKTNDGSLGKSGQGYAIWVDLFSPVSVNKSYKIGVQTDDGIVWGKLTTRGVSDLKVGQKWAAYAEIIVPSEAFRNEIKLVEQNRENNRNQVSKLEEQLKEIAYRSITEARWLDYDKMKADQSKAEQLTAQIEELKRKIGLAGC